jgi:RND superfamily putative drug exporter
VQIVVVAGVLLVFILLLRSLLAPIYLALSVILSYGTTMGICTLIFQNALGYSGVNYALPIIVFVLLVALGADYNIFLMSRVREEAKRTGDIHEGIRRATAFTGSVITSCGIILAGTFAALIFSPINMLMQIGTAVAIGVLVDTFIVRTLLVPAIATILGRWNWWPSRK